jgi:hypothetical protein
MPALRRTAKFEAAAFSVEGVTGAAAVVLAILALAGVYPVYLAPIATIAIGAAVLIKGGAVTARSPYLRDEAGEFTMPVDVNGGMSTELAAGAAGIALGVLALIGIAPAVLLMVAVIVFGGALLMGGGETFRLAQFGQRYFVAEETTRIAAESAGGAETLIGLAAIVLGILALTGVQPTTLTLVGLLIIGIAQLACGLALGARMASRAR